jgi:O-antigen/teichoic acid export membrane protein
MFEKVSFLPFVNLFKNKSIQNFIFLAIIQSSNVLISLIAMPLLIQSLGLANFGLVNLALSIMVLANIMVDFGYSLSAPRLVAIQSHDRVALSTILTEVILSKVLLAIVGSSILLVCIYFFGMFESYAKILAFSLIIIFSEAIFPLWLFQGLQKLKMVSMANIFSKLLFLMAIVLFIKNPNHAHWTNFLLGGSGLLINIGLLFYVHVFLDIKIFKTNIFAVFQSLKENFLLFLTNLTSHFSVNGGSIVLSFFSNAITLGMFVLSEKISFVLRMFPAMVIQAVFPNAAKLYHVDFDQFLIYMKKVYVLIIVLSLLLSLITFALAPWIVQVMTQSYVEASITYLRILSFLPFIACLNVVNVVILLVTDRKPLLFQLSWMMCLFMIVATVVLGLFFGATGLCFGLLAKELFVFLVGIILIYKNEKIIFHGFLASFRSNRID